MEHKYFAECPEVVSLMWAEARGGFVIVQSFVVVFLVGLCITSV